MNIDILSAEEVLAAVMIVGIVAAGTEFIKRGIRQHTKLTDDWTPRAVALVIGMVLATIVWPEDSQWNAWVVGLFLSLVAPVAYPVIVRKVRKK